MTVICTKKIKKNRPWIIDKLQNLIKVCKQKVWEQNPGTTDHILSCVLCWPGCGRLQSTSSNDSVIKYCMPSMKKAGLDAGNSQRYSNYTFWICWKPTYISLIWTRIGNVMILNGWHWVKILHMISILTFKSHIIFFSYW